MSKVVLGLRVRSWLLVMVCAALAGFLAAETVPWSAAAPKESDPPAATSSSGQAADYAKTLSKAFREAAGKVLPAVVAIQNRPPVAERTSPRGMSPDDEDFSDSPFGDLFRNNPDLRRFFRDQPRSIPHGPSGEVLSIGSGVIIDPAGVILTNNHVVDGTGKVVVRLTDGREFNAAEIKKDSKTDLAIVRIKGASNLKAARFGDSDKMAVGDRVASERELAERFRANRATVSRALGSLASEGLLVRRAARGTFDHFAGVSCSPCPPRFLPCFAVQLLADLLCRPIR